MADLPVTRKRLSPSTIVAIITVCTSVILGGIALWQNGHIEARQEAQARTAVIEGKIDTLATDIKDMQVKIAQIDQRLEDSINWRKP